MFSSNINFKKIEEGTTVWNSHRNTMACRGDLIAEFQRLTNCNSETAIEYLIRSEWEIEQAIDLYFDSESSSTRSSSSSKSIVPLRHLFSLLPGEIVPSSTTTIENSWPMNADLSKFSLGLTRDKRRRLIYD